MSVDENSASKRMRNNCFIFKSLIFKINGREAAEQIRFLNSLPHTRLKLSILKYSAPLRRKREHCSVLCCHFGITLQTIGKSTTWQRPIYGEPKFPLCC